MKIYMYISLIKSFYALAYLVHDVYDK